MGSHWASSFLIPLLSGLLFFESSALAIKKTAFGRTPSNDRDASGPRDFDYGPILGKWRYFPNGGFQKWANRETGPVDLLSSQMPSTATIDASPAVNSNALDTNALCPERMKAIQGKFFPTRIEGLQEQSCPARFVGRSGDDMGRCRQYNRARYESLRNSVADDEKLSRSFCIDEYEFPNRLGEYPMVHVTYREAEQHCATIGKRLCTEEEWTFACEGTEARPYPYVDWQFRTNYDLSPGNGCVFDRSSSGPQDRVADCAEFIRALPQGLQQRFQDRRRPGEPTRLVPYQIAGQLSRFDSDPERQGKILACLFRAEPSGQAAGCRSEFGVADTVGNIDEWTKKSYRSRPYNSVLKGGDWRAPRTRCRPATTGHDESHNFYNNGFRCCQNARAIH